MELFMDLLGNVGFPIAMCVLMFFLYKDTGEKHKEEMANVQATHKEEIARLTAVVDTCNVQVSNCLTSTNAAVATLSEVKQVVENNNRLFDLIANSLTKGE